MKYAKAVTHTSCNGSRPARGGWIEMDKSDLIDKGAQSRPARGGWIEIYVDGNVQTDL